MVRAVRSATLVLVLAAGCGSEEELGLHVLSMEVRDGPTPKVAIEVDVSLGCFFSVVLNGELKASGRWASGDHEVLIPGYLLMPRDNLVHLDVAAENGSSASADVEIEYCEMGEIECGDFPPDAGPVEGDGGDPGFDGGSLHRNLCAPCDGDQNCGGLPNECVFLPDEPGVCGTYCGDDYTCPDGFVCTQFQDATHTSLLCFPPGPAFICP